MSRWDDQFENHAIHLTIKEASDLINVEFDDTTSDEQSEKRRLSKLIDVFKETLDNLDPEIVPYNILDQINAAIRHQNTWNQLNAYNSSGSAQHLKNANDHLSNVLSQFSQILAIAKKSEITKPMKGLEKSLDEFADAIVAKKDTLEGDMEKISTTLSDQAAKIEELSGAIKAKKQEADTLINSWQEQHSNAQHKRDTDFIADQKVRTDTFATWKKEVEQDTESQVKDLIKNSNEKLSSEQTNFDKKISSFIENAENKHAAILDLYELVAGDSVASGYIKTADDERTQANFWRWATIVFIALTGAWTGLSYFLGNTIAPDGSVLWGQIIKAFSVTGVFIFGAVYSSTQSNSHRQNEKRTRWFALEVKAIDPFISSLSEGDRQKLKNKLSDRLFGQQNNSEKEISIMDEHAIGTIIKSATDLIKEIKDQK